jgi:putative MATE family efflux protein
MFIATFKDKAFLKRVLIIALPIVIQQLFLTTLGIVDTIMVGNFERGVASVGLASQISTIVGTVIFGITVGIGLYIAQYYGERNYENIRKSMALMIIIVFFIALFFNLLAFFFPTQLLGIFSDDEFVLELGSQYLIIASFSYVPNLLAFCFSIGYRNIQKTKVPLVVSIVTALFNVTLNYVLIHGFWFFPRLEVKGAGVATVISSFISIIFYIVHALITKEAIMPRLKDFKGAIRKMFALPKLKRTLPFLINETFFSVGSSLYIVVFNNVGTDAYEGYRIAETVISVMFIIIIGLGTAVGAMIGESLGKKDYEEAKRYSQNFLVIGIVMALALGLISIVFARPLVSIFQNNSPAVVDNAIKLMYVFAIRVSLRVLVIIMFSIFRAGGLSKFVMFIDSGVMWLIGIPIAFLSYYALGINNIVVLFLLLQIEPVVRLIISFRAYLKNKWAQNVLSN